MKKTWFFDPHFCAFSKNLCSIWRKRGCTRQKTTNTGWSACTISVKQKKPGAISNFRFFKILIFRFFQDCHCIVVPGHTDEVSGLLRGAKQSFVNLVTHFARPASRKVTLMKVSGLLRGAKQSFVNFHRQGTKWACTPPPPTQLSAAQELEIERARTATGVTNSKAC